MLKKTVNRTLSTAVASTLAVAGLPFVASPIAKAAPGSCTPIHVVSVPGTAASASNAPTEPRAIAPNYDVTKILQDRLGADKVSGWTTNYPASVGAVSIFWPVMGNGNTWGSEMVSYGESAKIGVANSAKHISEYKSACPNTKFMLLGYSQGSSVAGDLARDISAGKVSGVTPDDVSNVLLIADPGRSSTSAYDSYTGDKSVLWGPIPPGKMGKNFEILAPGEEINDSRVGWTGERQGRFKGMYGKVLSLCEPDDLACSAPPNSMLRAVADYADKESQLADLNSDLGKRVGAAVKNFTSKGGIQAAQSGDIQKVQALLAGSAAEANITIADLPAALNLLSELTAVFGDKIHPRCGEVDLAEGLKQVVVSTLPQFVNDQMSIKNILQAIKQFNVPVPKEVMDGLMMADKMNVGGVLDGILKRASGIVVNFIVDKAADMLGVKRVNLEKDDLEDWGSQMALAVGFPAAHATYWGDANQVNGKPSARYGVDWMTESGRNVLAGKSYVASAKGNNLTDPNKEIAIEDQTKANGEPVCPGDDIPGQENPGGSDNGSETPTPGNDDNESPAPGDTTKPGGSDDKPSTGDSKPDTKPSETTDPDDSADTGSTPGEDNQSNTGGTQPGNTTPGEDTNNSDSDQDTEPAAPTVDLVGLMSKWNLPNISIKPGAKTTIPGPEDVPEGTVFSLSEDAPEWVTIDPETGEITIDAPADVDPDEFNIKVSASNDGAATSSKSFTVKTIEADTPAPGNGRDGGESGGGSRVLARTGVDALPLALMGIGAIITALAAMALTRRRTA